MDDMTLRSIDKQATQYVLSMHDVKDAVQSKTIAYFDVYFESTERKEV